MSNLNPGLMPNSISAVQAAFDSGSAGEKSSFQAAVSGVKLLNGRLVDSANNWPLSRSFLHVISTVAPRITSQIGNSIMVGTGPINFATVAVWLTNGKLTQLGNNGVNSNRSAQMLARWTDVSALADNVQIMEGANDAGDNVAVAIHLSNIFTLAGNYLSRGQLPIVIMPPLNNVSSQTRAWTAKYRIAEWERGRNLGIAVANPWRRCFNSLDGSWKSGYTTDNTHPTMDAIKDVGALHAQDILTGHTPLPMPLYNTDPGGIMTNCMMLTDTNSDGVANGWSKNGGTGTASLSAATETGFAGNWQTLTGGGGFAYLEYGIAGGSGFSVGDKMMLVFALKAENLSATNTNQVTFAVRCNGGKYYIAFENCMSNLVAQHVAVFFTMETLDTIQIQAQVNGATVGQSISIGEMQLYNLTKCVL